MTLRILAIIALVTGPCFVIAADDPDVFLYAKGGPELKWVWAIKQSRMSALPKWDELNGEAPVSPHKALVATREFLQTRLDIYTPLLISVGLHRYHDDIWAYSIFFDSQKVSDHDEPLLDVMVLMDGKVVVPVEQRLK